MEVGEYIIIVDVIIDMYLFLMKKKLNWKCLCIIVGGGCNKVMVMFFNVDYIMWDFIKYMKVMFFGEVGYYKGVM